MSEADEWSVLMTRAQAGDQASYRALLRHITPLLTSIARRSMRQPQDVEDAVQDILLTVHVIRATYDPQRPFRPWLIGVARNRIADRVRVRARRHAREVALAPEHETFAAGTAKSDVGLDDARLHEAVARLPAGQRQALEMMKLKEMSLQEASAQTGLSITALKVATHRGLKQLRRVLGDDS